MDVYFLIGCHEFNLFMYLPDYYFAYIPPPSPGIPQFGNHCGTHPPILYSRWQYSPYTMNCNPPGNKKKIVEVSKIWSIYYIECTLYKETSTHTTSYSLPAHMNIDATVSTWQVSELTRGLTLYPFFTTSTWRLPFWVSEIVQNYSNLSFMKTCYRAGTLNYIDFIWYISAHETSFLKWYFFILLKQQSVCNIIYSIPNNAKLERLKWYEWNRNTVAFVNKKIRKWIHCNIWGRMPCWNCLKHACFAFSYI